MDFHVVGDFAYASVGFCNGLHTYDISDPLNPVRMQTDGLPAWRVSVSGDTAYSFLHGLGLQVFDISGGPGVIVDSYDPSDPTVFYEGGVRVGDVLYAAAHQHGVQVLHVSTPGAITQVSEITLADNACWNVVESDGYLFIANGRFGLSVVDLSAMPIEVGSLDLPGLANDIEVSGTVAFLSLGADGIASVDISDPEHPTLLDLAPTLGNAFSMGLVGDILGVGSYSYAERFDVSDPSAIARSGWDATRVFAAGADMGVLSNGDTVMVVADWRGIGVFSPAADSGGDIDVYPDRLDFGSVDAGGSGTTVAVRNTGSGALEITSIGTPAEIAVDPSSLTLDPGETRWITVTAVGVSTVDDSILYYSDDPDEPTFVQHVYKNSRAFPQIGSEAPDFTLNGTDGQAHTLSDYRGKVVYLQFGSSASPISALQVAVTDGSIYARYDTSQVAILGIAYTQAMLAEFRDVFGMRFLGLEDRVSSVYTMYGVPDAHAPYPRDFVIDQGGIVRYWSPEYDPQEVMTTIDGLLAGTGVDDGTLASQQRAVISLAPPSQNPFRPGTDLRYAVSERIPVTLNIYSVAGGLVRTLVRGTSYPGEHVVTWDGRDDGGMRVASGVYFARLEAGERTAARKMVLLR